MRNDNAIHNDNTDILKEIFISPSEKIIPDRFSESNNVESPICHGKCDSGVCRYLE